MLLRPEEIVIFALGLIFMWGSTILIGITSLVARRRYSRLGFPLFMAFFTGIVASAAFTALIVSVKDRSDITRFLENEPYLIFYSMVFMSALFFATLVRQSVWHRMDTSTASAVAKAMEKHIEERPREKSNEENHKQTGE